MDAITKEFRAVIVGLVSDKLIVCGSSVTISSGSKQPSGKGKRSSLSRLPLLKATCDGGKSSKVNQVMGSSLSRDPTGCYELWGLRCCYDCCCYSPYTL